jgi:hypothetical protein
MKIAVYSSVLAVLIAFTATASASLSTPTQHPCGVQASFDEPVDCPFCGGNPALHIRRLVDLERTNMAIFARLAR